MTIPLGVQVAFAHAALEHVAERNRVDLLHIKGAALDPSLSAPSRTGSDADVMVRPSQLDRLVAALIEHRWSIHTHFATGSPFGHALTMVHPEWGYADLHRFFPGITLDPEAAFTRLWADRSSRAIAEISCPVPDLTAQRLLLTLNAARNGIHGADDLRRAWFDASADQRAAVRARAAELDAEVGLAAAIGELELYRNHRSYRLWRVTTQGGTRSEEWMARVIAARSPGDALRVAIRAPRVNTEQLALRLGRQPTRREVATEFSTRAAQGLREALGHLRRWTTARRSR